MTLPGSTTFGVVLKRYRRAAHLTQEELAARAGLSVEAISALERGTRQAPRKDTVQLIIEALALAPSEGATLQQAAQHQDRAPLYGALALAAESAAIPLVGRIEEMAHAERFLAAPGQRLLLLAGEPGIGKTRLLSQIGRAASERGWCVLQGGCFSHSGQVSYAPLVDALRAYVQGQSPTRLREVLRTCAHLDALLPELREVAPAGSSVTLPSDQERSRLFGAVGAFLATIAGPAGTLLALDDMHWAGDDALALLATLLRSPAAAGVRVVAAYSPVEVSPRSPLLRLSTQLARAGLVWHTDIGPLAPTEAQALFASLVPPEQHDTAIAERVVSRAGGVPFFVVSCAHGLRAGALGQVSQVGQVGQEGANAIPWDAAETVRQRVAMLPDTVDEIVSIAAIAERIVPRAVVLAVARESGRAEDEIITALDAACHARLLAEEGEDAYTFAHGFIREVIWTDLGAARRASLHRRVAEVIERQPGPPPVEVLAYHFARCGDHTKAAHYLELAGDSAARAQAHSAAAVFYRDLVDQCVLLGSSGDVARAREKLGEVLRIQARYDDALRVLKEAVSAYSGLGDQEGWRRATAQIGRVHARRGTPQEGIAAVNAVLSTARTASRDGTGTRTTGIGVRGGEDTGQDTSQGTAGFVALHLALAELAQATGHYHQQLREATHAAEIATHLGDPALRAQAEHWRGVALLALGRSNEALPALAEVIPLAEAVGNLSLHAQALSQVALAQINRGEFVRAQEAVTSALEVAQRRGDPSQLAFMVCNRGFVGTYLGAWKDARADFERAATSMREIGMVWGTAYPLLGLGHLSMLQGQYGVAVRLLQEATTQAERMGDPQVHRLIQAPLIERDLTEHHGEAANDRLARLLQSDRSVVFEGAAYLLALSAWAALELGNLGLAGEMLAHSLERAGAEQHLLARMSALMVRSRLAAQRQQWTEALADAEEVATRCQAMPYPCGEARALTLQGMALAGAGELRLARRRLDAAVAIFAQLGEQLYRQETEKAIHGLVH